MFCHFHAEHRIYGDIYLNKYFYICKIYLSSIHDQNVAYFFFLQFSRKIYLLKTHTFILKFLSNCQQEKRKSNITGQPRLRKFFALFMVINSCASRRCFSDNGLYLGRGKCPIIQYMTRTNHTKKILSFILTF